MGLLVSDGLTLLIRQDEVGSKTYFYHLTFLLTVGICCKYLYYFILCLMFWILLTFIIVFIVKHFITLFLRCYINKVITIHVWDVDGIHSIYSILFYLCNTCPIYLYMFKGYCSTMGGALGTLSYG